MAAQLKRHRQGGRVYYLLPAERVVALLERDGAPLGPLAGPLVEPAPPPPPEPSPPAGPSYGPRSQAEPAAGSPRGFFLDRYVY